MVLSSYSIILGYVWWSVSVCITVVWSGLGLVGLGKKCFDVNDPGMELCDGVCDFEKVPPTLPKR